MTGVAEGGGKAYDAEVLTASSTEELKAELARRGELPLDAQQQRERYADEADAAVATIEAQLDSVKEALKAKKAEAKQLRADVDEGADR